MVEIRNRQDEVRQLITRIGGPTLMQKLDVSSNMLRHVAREGVMPPGWYAKVKEAAAEVGADEPPLDLFGFK